MLTSNKELKKLLEEAEGYGWVFTKGNRHIKGRHPTGKTTTISISPSDRRALMNIKKDLRVGE
jgi:predicted RNA binding protein YcfA (HicA-like mRNA interferase family)